MTLPLERIVLLDFKRYVSEKALEECLFSFSGVQLIAATPVALHLAERLKKPCRHLSDELDIEAYSHSTSAFYPRLRTLFASVYKSRAIVMQGTLGRKLIITLNGLAQESMKRHWLKKALQSYEVILLSDVPVLTDADQFNFRHLEDDDYKNHRTLLYPMGLENIHKQVLPRLSTPAPKQTRSRYFWKYRKLNIINSFVKRFLLPQSGASCLGKYDYEVAYLYRDIASQLRPLEEDVVGDYYMHHAPSENEKTHPSPFLKAFRQEFEKDFDPQLFSFYFKQISPYISKVESIADFWETHVERFRQEKKITHIFMSSGFADPVVNIAAGFMRNSTKSIVAPHGPLFHESTVLEMNEGSFGNIMLTPAKRVTGFKNSTIKCIPTGFRSFCVFSPKKKKETTPYLYVLFPIKGQQEYTGSEHYMRRNFCGDDLYIRHKKVFDLFARYPNIPLKVRPHPAMLRESFQYEPLQEYAEFIGAANITFDYSKGRGDDYFADCGCLLFDYACTGLTEALFKGNYRILAHIGDPIRTTNQEVCNMLKQTILTAENDDEFLSLIAGELSGKMKIPATKDEPRNHFLTEFGVLPITEKEVKKKQLEAIFGSSSHTVQGNNLQTKLNARRNNHRY